MNSPVLKKKLCFEPRVNRKEREKYASKEPKIDARKGIYCNISCLGIIVVCVCLSHFLSALHDCLTIACTTIRIYVY